jgi:sugar (pentulose or hexulose) kinase
MAMLNLLAIDIGASSGKCFIGSYDGNKLTLEEIRRFENGPVAMGNNLYWDTVRHYQEIKRAVYSSKDFISSVSIDTMGQDFSLMLGDMPLSYVRAYRDPANIAAMDIVDSIVPFRDIYARTGCIPCSGASLVQLTEMREMAGIADGLLFTPDLHNFMLCGAKACEPSIASTSMIFGWDCWDEELANIFNVGHLLPDTVECGTVLGNVSTDGFKEDVKVIAGAGHDTAAAVASMPTDEAIFITCGTWSAVGVIVDRIINSDEAFENNFTNQRTGDGRNRFSNSFSGLWIFQQYAAEAGLSYAQLEELAQRAETHSRLINVRDSRFFPVGAMLPRINAFLEETGQHPCSNAGEAVRCIYESLAMEYKKTIIAAEKILNIRKENVCLLGGGTRSKLLCRFTANATGKRTIAGSADSSALGNCIVQLSALNEIKKGEDFSELAKNSIVREEYYPEETAYWDERYDFYLRICNC